MNSRLTTLEGSQAKDESKKADAKEETETIQSIKTEPKVRYCNWEQFKNRYTPEECTFAIEVLLAGDDLDGEMEEEQLKRLPAEKREKLIETKRKKPSRRPRADKRPDRQRMERVRINSSAILSFIGGVTGEMSWAEKPHTFLRPFKILIHFHDQLEEEFDKLKARFEDDSQATQEVSQSEPGADGRGKSSVEDSSQLAGKEPQVKSTEDELLSNAPSVAIESTKPDTEPMKGELSIGSSPISRNKPVSHSWEKITEAGFKEIKCYMELARERLLPTYRKFEEKDHTQRVKVRYDDLWSLFRIGEFVFFRRDSKGSSSNTEAENHRSPDGRQKSRRLWRLHSIESANVDWAVQNLDSENGDFRRNTLEKETELKLGVYYIDYDGNSYCGLSYLWTLQPFEGEKDVTKLDFYPARFEKDYEAKISKLVDSGERFQKLLLSTEPAVQHDGWTLTHDPAGSKLEDEAGKTAEYVDSDVIIDFQEAYQMNPSWKPSFFSYKKPTFEPETTFDEFAVIQWSGPDRSKPITKLTEVVVSLDDVDTLKWNKFADEDNFIMDPDLRPVESRQAKREVTGQDLALLPSRMFVYSLRNRKFINADVQNLKPIQLMSDPFSDLKIEEPHKRLIRSVVQDHFDKKSIQRQLRAQDIEPLEQDFIRGKGKGLVIMLHGAPGVGKTATAEAIAAAHRKPLFAITCGDLGIDPREVESTLSEIFRLANLWDCILLLDEAEIFLSRREKKDDNLQRNALVSSKCPTASA